MCFYSDDDAPEMMTESTPKARKDHTCCECREVIPRGERYHLVSGKWDGNFDTFRTCRRCCFDRNRVVEHEIAEGCDWEDSWPPFGHLVGHLEESGMGQTKPEDVPVSFQAGDEPNVIQAEDRGPLVVASRLPSREPIGA